MDNNQIAGRLTFCAELISDVLHRSIHIAALLDFSKLNISLERFSGAPPGGREIIIKYNY